MSNLTKKDLIVLTLMTNYLFCDDFKEALEFARAILEEHIELHELYDRKIQASLKGLLWNDFLKLKKKLREMVE